jgi:hypothetical protein
MVRKIQHGGMHNYARHTCYTTGAAKPESAPDTTCFIEGFRKNLYPFTYNSAPTFSGAGFSTN